MARRQRRSRGRRSNGAGRIVAGTLLLLVAAVVGGGFAYLKLTTPAPPRLDAETLCPVDGPRSITVVLVDASDDLPEAGRREVTTRLDDIAVHLCHGSPVRLEEFEYIFAPEQARECLPIYAQLGHLTLIGHSHLCKVFALTPNSVEELPPIDFELQPDRKYIVSVGSVGQPRDYDNRASYTVYDSDKKRFEFKGDAQRLAAEYGLGVYQCQICGGWHFTSKPPASALNRAIW